MKKPPLFPSFPSAVLALTLTLGALVLTATSRETRVQAVGSLTVTTQTFPVGNKPYAVTFDGSNVWVVNEFSNNVSVLHASDGSLVTTYATGANPTGITFDGAKMWIVNNAGSSVTVLRASDGSLLQTASVGSSPIGAAFDNTNVWVTNWGSGLGKTVSVLRASDYSNVATYGVGSGPFSLAFDGTNMWVGNGDNTISVIRASDGYYVMTPTVPSSLGLAFDGANMWATNYYNNSVSVLRATDGLIVRTRSVGTNPFGIAFDGANMWVANQGSNTVSVLNASSGHLIGTIPVGAKPQGIVFDGVNMWVANSGSNTVTKINVAEIPTPTQTPLWSLYLPIVLRQPIPTPTFTPTPTLTPIPPRPTLQDGNYFGNASSNGTIQFTITNAGRTATNGYFRYYCSLDGLWWSWSFANPATINNGAFLFGDLYDRYGNPQIGLNCSSTTSTQAYCDVINYFDNRFCGSSGYANRQ